MNADDRTWLRAQLLALAPEGVPLDLLWQAAELGAGMESYAIAREAHERAAECSKGNRTATARALTYLADALAVDRRETFGPGPDDATDDEGDEHDDPMDPYTSEGQR